MLKTISLIFNNGLPPNAIFRWGSRTQTSRQGADYFSIAVSGERNTKITNITENQLIITMKAIPTFKVAPQSIFRKGYSDPDLYQLFNDSSTKGSF